MLLTVICLVYIVKSIESSLVITTSGPVLGKLVQDDMGATYHAYQGIPYAEPPIGKLRFKPPIPKRPWNSILHATKEGPICPQSEGRYSRDDMSEDCLTLNIYVPEGNRTYLRPVFFYVHGGGFKSNSGNIGVMYGPQFFLQHDIIYVSLNYRIGALGFLSLGIEDAAGNVGIKDILLALTWIKNNIWKFGGSTVTISGESSGSAAIHYLLLTEKSTGLIQRALLKSGSATNFRFISKQPSENAKALAVELGFDTDNIYSMLENFTNADAFDIVAAQESIHKDDRSIVRPFSPFVPCIEKESRHAVITKDPLKVIESGIPLNIPIMSGINAQEGIYMWQSLHTKPEGFLRQNFVLCIPPDVGYQINSTLYKDLVDSVSKIYFGDPQLTNWSLTNFYDLLSDTQYTNSVDMWIRLHAQMKNSKPVYYYVFDFDGDLNWAKINYNISFPGMAHADELGYMFVTAATKGNLKNIDDKSRRALDNTLTLFTNFIKYGNPTPNSQGDIYWPEYGEKGHHIVLKDEPEIRFQAPNKVRFDFWDAVYRQSYTINCF